MLPNRWRNTSRIICSNQGIISRHRNTPRILPITVVESSFVHLVLTNSLLIFSVLSVFVFLFLVYWVDLRLKIILVFFHVFPRVWEQHQDFQLLPFWCITAESLRITQSIWLSMCRTNKISYADASQYLPDGFSSWMLLGKKRRKLYITPPHYTRLSE